MYEWLVMPLLDRYRDLINYSECRRRLAQKISGYMSGSKRTRDSPHLSLQGQFSYIYPHTLLAHTLKARRGDCALFCLKPPQMTRVISQKPQPGLGDEPTGSELKFHLLPKVVIYSVRTWDSRVNVEEQSIPFDKLVVSE